MNLIPSHHTRVFVQPASSVTCTGMPQSFSSTYPYHASIYSFHGRLHHANIIVRLSVACAAICTVPLTHLDTAFSAAMKESEQTSMQHSTSMLCHAHAQPVCHYFHYSKATSTAHTYSVRARCLHASDEPIHFFCTPSKCV